MATLSDYLLQAARTASNAIRNSTAGKTTIIAGNSAYTPRDFGITESLGLKTQPVTVNLNKVAEQNAKSNNKKSNNNKSSSGSSSKKVDPMQSFYDREGLTKDQYKQQAANIQLQFDKGNAMAKQQIGDLETAKGTDLSILEQALKAVTNQADTTKSNLYEQAESARQQGASAANQAEIKSRNVLRGLGILNSSAAGELLSRPATEYQKQAADVERQLSSGLKEIDDFVRMKTEENALKVQQIINQYTSLIGKIQTDLRFSDKERFAAQQQALLARDQMLGQIRTEQTNYQLAAQNAASSLLSDYKNLGAQTSSNLGSAYQNLSDPAIYASKVPNVQNQGQTGINIYSDTNKKKNQYPNIDWTNFNV